MFIFNLYKCKYNIVRVDDAENVVTNDILVKVFSFLVLWPLFIYLSLFLTSSICLIDILQVFAMPETALSLFPDVGASYFLSRLPGFFGKTS